jgi:hypothetical protein
MIHGMKRQRTKSGSELDVATIRRSARVAGLELSRRRAERLLPALAALIAADCRLRTLDLGDSAASDKPWGRSPRDE